MKIGEKDPGLENALNYLQDISGCNKLSNKEVPYKAPQRHVVGIKLLKLK